jgi:hypothetical protein
MIFSGDVLEHIGTMCITPVNSCVLILSPLGLPASILPALRWGRLGVMFAPSNALRAGRHELLL